MQPFTFVYDTFYDYYTNQNNLLIDNTKINEKNFVIYYTKVKSRSKRTKSHRTEISDNYILVNGTHYYVKVNDETKTILFTFPTNIDNTLYDFHYHFGSKPDELTERTIDEWMVINDPIPNSTLRNTSSKNKNKNKNKSRNKTSRKNKKGGSNELIEYEPTLSKKILDTTESMVYFHKTIQNPNEKKPEHINCYFQDNTVIDDVNHIICIDYNDENKSYPMNHKGLYGLTIVLQNILN